MRPALHPLPARPTRTTPDRSLRTSGCNTDRKYSWLKAPRYDGAGDGGRTARAGARRLRVRRAPRCDEPSTARCEPLGATTGELYSTLGRVIARALETRLVVDRLDGWLDSARAEHESGDLRIADTSHWDRSTWPSQARGFGPHEVTARLTRALGRDLQRTDQALPGGGTDDVERLAAGRHRPAGTIRAGTGRHSRGGSGPPAGTAAHAPLVRSLPRVRGARARADCAERTAGATAGHGWPGSQTRPRRPRSDRALPTARSVYVWELPVRIVHWTIVVTLIVLSFTGYYLYHPFFGPAAGSGPGHPGFTLATIRSIHEITGFTSSPRLFARSYWALVGNRYAHWRGLLPLTAAQRRDLLETIRFYALSSAPSAADDTATTRSRPRLPRALRLLRAVDPVRTRPVRVGHQDRSVDDVVRLDLRERAANRAVASAPLPADVRLRRFTIHHVYSSILFDLEERNGELSSIVTGYKADARDGGTPSDATRPAPE